MRTRKDTLIIFDSVPEFRNFFRKAGIATYPTFRKIKTTGILGFYLRFIRRISFQLKIFPEFWYSGWKGRLDKVDTVLCFMTKYNAHVQYIKSKYPSKRVILWYWNPVFRYPSPLIGQNYELWSFDKGDCKRYGMRYNSTFYFKNITVSNKSKKYDIVFLGYAKNREEQLRNMESEFTRIGLSTYFHVVSSSNSDTTAIKPIAYQNYLHLLEEANAILDLVQEGQQGLTLRPMEALFLNKKLITNSTSIDKEAFYDSENIFILGKDDLSTIKEFLAKPYRPVSSKCIGYYDVEKWLERFFHE